MIHIPTDLITVGPRRRKIDWDFVKELADSIQKVGLINPITVQPDPGPEERYQLVAGAHRLEAIWLLGHKTIEAVMFDGDELDAELAEIDENLQRNDLSKLEQGEHLSRRLEILEILGERAPSHRPSKGDNLTPLTDLAAQLGYNERTAQRRAQIARDIDPAVRDMIRETALADNQEELLSLSRLDPDEQTQAAGAYVSGEAATFRQALRVVRHANKDSQEFPEGTYQVIYVDPPWEYANSGFDQSAAAHYPTMTIDEICALPVADLAAEPAVLFIWVTAPMLEEGLKVMKAWGFEYRTGRVWVKDRFPPIGWWINTRHEHLLIGTRSGNAHPSERLDSVIEAVVTEHSRKPAQVYADIERTYPGPKIELFSRNPRDGWTAWGNELLHSQGEN